MQHACSCKAESTDVIAGLGGRSRIGLFVRTLEAFHVYFWSNT